MHAAISHAHVALLLESLNAIWIFLRAPRMSLSYGLNCSGVDSRQYLGATCLETDVAFLLTEVMHSEDTSVP